MDMKKHLKSALKALGFDKPRKAQIIPMNTLDAEQDAIIIAKIALIRKHGILIMEMILLKNKKVKLLKI